MARIHGSARWQAVRARVLRDEPVCLECARLGVTEPATQVDHVVPLAVAPEPAFDRANGPGYANVERAVPAPRAR